MMPRGLILAAAAMLLGGLAPLPYGYFTLLRLVACITLAWAAFVAHRRHVPAMPVIFGILALLFNPLIPVHLSRGAWGMIDAGTALLLMAFASPLTRADAASTSVSLRA